MGQTEVIDVNALMQRVAGGDQEAFAALYDELSGIVYGLASRVIRDRARAEEVTQEVFVQVWRLAARYDPERGSARSWVATIAHRRAVDCVRSDQRLRDREDREGRTREVAPDGPSVVLDARLDRERIAGALEHLTDLQREAIELAYFGGRTHREIAELLGVPLGTVKSRIRHALLRLRAHLEVA